MTDQTETGSLSRDRKRRWWQGFSARLMLSSAALSITVILITSAISYNALREMSLTVANQSLEGQARTLSHDIEERIFSLLDNLRELSSNALIANALADDVGRETYLRDFVSGLSASAGFELTVVMTNFQGHAIASNRPDAELLMPPEWIAQIVDRAVGHGKVILVGDAPYLLLAEPIIFRNTGTAEGALIFQVNLTEWLSFDFIRRVFSEAKWLSILDLHTATATPPLQARHRPSSNAPFLDVPLTLPLSISGESLIISLGARPDFIDKPLNKLLGNVLAMSGGIFIVVLFGSFVLSRRQARKLARLQHEAKKVSEVKNLDISFTSDEQDEIDDLADAFTVLVDELKQAYRQLENESQREIASREQRFQSIVHNSAEGIITLSNKGIIETFNPSAENIFLYGADEVIGQSINILMPESERAEHDQYIHDSDLHQSRIINRARDLQGLRKDGETFPIELNVSPMHLDGEQKFIGIMRDISDRKEFEGRLNAARIEAEQANLAKSQFLSSMSHELRTPLNAVLGFGQLLKMEKLTASQGAAVDQILKGGDLLLELVDQVLNLARIETGNLTVSIESIDVTPLLKDALAMARTMADKRNIHIEHNIPEMQSVFVYADLTRLKQILLNLLSNASKYNREGGTISLSCRVIDDRCRFEIKDTGQGIAEELHDQVFMPFNRLGAENGDIEGTGIGLTITKELTQLMSGSIGFTSKEGQGSLFWFELPLAPGLEATTAVQSQIDAIDTLDQRNLPHKTVLYVEDNTANLQLMKMILTKYDHVQMLSANTAEDGLVMAKNARPDLILMDINLPGMNGIEALKALRSDIETTTIPVIAISANAMEKDIQYALDIGFEDYLVKPIHVGKTLEAIAKSLQF